MTAIILQRTPRRTCAGARFHPKQRRLAAGSLVWHHFSVRCYLSCPDARVAKTARLPVANRMTAPGETSSKF